MTTSNKVKYGLENVHYAVIADAESGRTYGTPVRLPGGVAMTAEPRGEKSDFFADNKEYYAVEANDGYTGTLEVALLPDGFLKNVLKYKEDANGALFEDANAAPAKIALLFEFKGDAKKTRHVFYDVTVSRPPVSSKTQTRGLEVQTESFPFVAVPDPVTGYPKASIKQGQTGYDTFFGAVYTFVVPQPPQG